MVLENGLVGMSCTLSRHWGVPLPGLFVRKARHLPTCVCHVHTFISTLCLILCFCWPHFYCGSRFLLNFFFFSLHFPLPVVRSLIHCAQVSSVCSVHPSSDLFYLPSTLASQVFPCQFLGLLPALLQFYATTHEASDSGALYVQP